MKPPGSDVAQASPALPRYRLGLGLFLTLLALWVHAGAESGDSVSTPIVFTQLPVGTHGPPSAGGALQMDCDGARISMLDEGGKTRVLTAGFHGACDPDVSFDGLRMLFAGKREASDPWNVFEMELEGGASRQITRDLGNCRKPTYQGRLFTLDSPEPWYQITFVSDHSGEIDGHGATRSTSLYTVRLDGSGAERLTYNPSSDLDPTVLPDGRLLFSSWQRGTLERGPFGRIALFAVQIDGLDYAAFSGEQGRRVQRMPCVTDDRRVVFVESDTLTWDGAGSLGSLSLRRNLHSYESIPVHGDGLYHSPSALPGGLVLVSRRPADGEGTHGIHRLDPGSGKMEAVFDDPALHDVQARLVTSRERPDGRSTVVSSDFSTGVLYGLNAYDSDLGAAWVSAPEPLRLRVLEGVPSASSVHKRFLGEIDVEKDGSFNVQVPANTPIQLQLIDADGLALRTCDWIWVRNRETRGCIGCHEDGERTPENRFVTALSKPSIPLDLPPEKRRTVDFRRDVAPILSNGCGSASCHDAGGSDLLVSVESHVHPERARTSPLIWHVYGRNTSRPWDGASAEAAVPMPLAQQGPLSAGDRRTLAEWIDLGAHQGGER